MANVPPNPITIISALVLAWLAAEIITYITTLIHNEVHRQWDNTMPTRE